MNYYGYSPDNQDVMNEYIVEIVSSRVGVVRGVMQQEVILPGNTNNYSSAIQAGTDFVALAAKFLPGTENVASVVSGFFKSPITGAIGQIIGISPQAQWFSRRIWIGASQESMVVLLKFRAVKDAKNEVTDALKALQKLSMPDEAGGLLIPPGPFVLPEKMQAGIVAKQDLVSIQIGERYFIPKVVVKHVRTSFSAKMTPQGHPVEGQASITFEPFETVTKKDIDDWVIS